jgi:hypothetical protein
MLRVGPASIYPRNARDASDTFKLAIEQQPEHEQPCSGSNFRINLYPMKSITAKPKKRGRPATGRFPMMGLRASPGTREKIERWAKSQPDAPSLSEAIRRLVELGLAGSRPESRRSPKAAAKASELAGRQIDKLADSSATDEERHSRKRRLLKGPAEFREMRGDLAKPKR